MTERNAARLDAAERAVRAGASIIGAVVAVIALMIAISHQNDVTTSRRESARDSCLLFRGLVRHATPPSRSADERAFELRTPLYDCRVYARSVVR